MIQIGLPCEPEWLCDAISMTLGIIVVFLVIKFLSVLFTQK